MQFLETNSHMHRCNSHPHPHICSSHPHPHVCHCMAGLKTLWTYRTLQSFRVENILYAGVTLALQPV